MSERRAPMNETTGNSVGRRILSLLSADIFALISFLFLATLILIVIIGPAYLTDIATQINLRLRHVPPFTLENGWANLLGADALGRPIAPRLVVAGRTTLFIALSAVILAMVAASVLGLIAGYLGGTIENLIMRVADVMMSFPSLLLAVFVLYVLAPDVTAVIIVLAVTRAPVYIRVVRAEVLEVKERLFVEAARAAGAQRLRIIALHIAPMVIPTVFTVATLDIANVMLAESSLSFLGIGVQPPGITWGVMVATGRNYLTNAWWHAFWPGLAIMLTALSANLLSNWLRIAMDPKLRWRLERSQVRHEDLTEASRVNIRDHTMAGRNSEAHALQLEVSDLRVIFEIGDRTVRAVNGVSFDVRCGETLAILGESGSGKTVTFEAILGVLESPPGHVTHGRAMWRGQDLLSLPASQRRAICGRHLALIFQDPLSALNPVYSVGWQIAEMARVHNGLSRAAARERAIDLMDAVGIPASRDRFTDYPHQFSGGMRQRVVIAMALAADPELVIADEPTTALDVTVEAQILELLRTLQRKKGIGLVLITHSWGVVAEIADRVAVMYAGEIVETAPVVELFDQPAHPYTQGLLKSMPRPGAGASRLQAIRGQPPDLSDLPVGCAFHPRCPLAQEICRTETPRPHVFADGRRSSSCHYFQELVDYG